MGGLKCISLQYCLFPTLGVGLLEFKLNSSPCPVYFARSGDIRNKACYCLALLFSSTLRSQFLRRAHRQARRVLWRGAVAPSAPKRKIPKAQLLSTLKPQVSPYCNLQYTSCKQCKQCVNNVDKPLYQDVSAFVQPSKAWIRCSSVAVVGELLTWQRTTQRVSGGFGGIRSLCPSSSEISRTRTSTRPGRSFKKATP